MSILKPRSTKNAFLLVIVPVMISMIVLLIVFSKYRDYKLTHSYLEEKLGLLGISHHEILANPLWNLDDKRVQQVLDALQNDPDVAGTVVFDEVHSVFGSTGILRGLTYAAVLQLEKDIEEEKHSFQQHFWGTCISSSINHRLSIRKSSIFFSTDTGSETIGSLFFVLTTKNLSKQFDARLRFDILNYFLLAVVLVAGIMAVYSRTTSVPLKKLHDVILAIQEGKEQTPIHWEGENEIGRAIVAFNELQTQQLAFKKELESARNTLETRVRDLQERTAELEESENRFGILLEQVPNIAVRGYSLDGTIQYWNKANETIYGYTQEEAVGKKLIDLIVPPEKQDSIHAALTQGIHSDELPFHGELQMMKKDGSPVDVYSSHVVVRRVNHEPILFSLDLDLTDRKKLEKGLIQAHKIEAIGTLAGGIAHDFNNILAIIIFYANLALDDIPDDSNAGTDIDKIISSAERGAELVKQILFFSRKTAHEKIPFAPHLIVKEALKMLRATLPSTITIEEDIDRKCGCILADPTNIHQLVINLCTNALHAMTDEKGILSVSLHRLELDKKDVAGKGVSSTDTFVVLTVSDTGCGMDQQTVDRIYEPYFTTKEMGKGTGLGLAVIHGIVKEYNGFIKVESTVDKGSSFIVYLPAMQSDRVDSECGLSDIPEEEYDSCTGNERILVVDDELLLVRATQRQLECLGYTVTATADSSDALEQVLADPEQFDLIITDQTMPGLTGAELIQAVRKIKSDMPIILCTGYSRVLSKEDCLAMGINSYVSKPIMGNELFVAVREVLDKKA